MVIYVEKNDGAIVSDESWKSTMSKGGRNKLEEDWSILHLIHQGREDSLFQRALQGHLRDAISKLILFITGRMYLLFRADWRRVHWSQRRDVAINLHSITNSGLIPSKTEIWADIETDDYSSVAYPSGSNKQLNTKIRMSNDLDAPRHAHYMHKALKVTFKTRLLSWHQSCSWQDNDWSSIKHELTQSSIHGSSQLIGMSESIVGLQNWRSQDWYRESICVTKLLKRPDGQVVQQFRSIPIEPTRITKTQIQST